MRAAASGACSGERADRVPGQPFLKADPAKVARWQRELARLGDAAEDGVSWRGGSIRTRAITRSIGLGDWAPILAVPGCEFVSLQYGDVAEEVRELNAGGAQRVHVWQEALDDYDETAALVCALDLVVTVCTALVHLSGGLGQEAWVLVPSIPEWRDRLEGERMPWYSDLVTLIASKRRTSSRYRRWNGSDTVWVLTSPAAAERQRGDATQAKERSC